MIRDGWGGAPWGAAEAEEGNLETEQTVSDIACLWAQGVRVGVSYPLGGLESGKNSFLFKWWGGLYCAMAGV